MVTSTPPHVRVAPTSLCSHGVSMFGFTRHKLDLDRTLPWHLAGAELDARTVPWPMAPSDSIISKVLSSVSAVSV